AAQRLTRVGSWELDLGNLADLNRNPLRWSDEVFRIFGHSPGAIPVSNDSFFQAVHPDDRMLVQEAVRTALETGTRYSIDHRIILPDGTERIVHEEAQIETDPEVGPGPRMVGTVQDVTEDRRFAAAMRASEERLQLALVAGRMVAWEHDYVSGTISLSAN